MKKHLLFFFFGLLFFSSSAQIVPTGNLRILEIIDNSADTFSFVGRFSDFKRRDLPTDVNVGDIVSVDSAGILYRHVITSVNLQSSSSSSLNIETVCESCPNISIGVFQVSRGIGNEKITPASAGIDDTLRELIEADNITKIINLINNPAPVDWGNLQNVPAGFSDNIDDTSDADSDPTNELQTAADVNADAIAGTTGTNVQEILSSLAGRTDEVNDADADSTNEIQSLSYAANTQSISISGANSVTIDVNDADNFPDTWANLPGKPAGFSDNVDDVNDADSDPDNEKQTVTRTGNDLTLSLGGGTQAVLDIYEYRVINVTTAGATVALGVTPDLTYRPEVRRNGVWQDVNLPGSDVTIVGSNITANHRNWKSGDKIQLRYVPQ